MIPLALGVLLFAAVLSDVRMRRIPNKLVLSGIALGVMLHLFLPAEGGFPGSSDIVLGFYKALLGLASGFAVFLPFYLLRAMGAGDVKLMAMVGVFIGAANVLDAAVLTLVCGGVMAVGVALWNGRFRDAVTNVEFMLTDAVVRVMTNGTPEVKAAAKSAGDLPYAVAIAGGVFFEVLLSRAGHSIFF
jgi:prepilin peptidase CpaA